MWLQTQTRVHEAAGQTLWPFHWEHSGWDRRQHAVCEGVCWSFCVCEAHVSVSLSVFYLFFFLLSVSLCFLPSRSSQASSCQIRKWARTWRSTCSACRSTPRGKRSRPRRLRATPSTPSGRRRPLCSRRWGCGFCARTQWHHLYLNSFFSIDFSSSV